MFYNQIERAVTLPVIHSLDQLSESLLVQHENGFVHSVTNALRSDNLGLAFATGYRGALQYLLPELDMQRWAAFCVTERQGNHPRMIATTVNGQGVLTGEKCYVSLATMHPQLVIVANAGEPNGRPLLKAVLADSFDEKISIEAMPAIDMIPEISHGRIVFDNVKGKVLPGDGYDDYSKRFRVIEDSFVLSAFCAHITGVSLRNNFPSFIIQRAISILSSIRTVLADKQELTSPMMHLQLGDLYSLFNDIVSDFEASINRLSSEEVGSWHRDKKIFQIAHKARALRTEKAIQWLANIGVTKGAV